MQKKPCKLKNFKKVTGKVRNTGSWEAGNGANCEKPVHYLYIHTSLAQTPELYARKQPDGVQIGIKTFPIPNSIKKM